MRDKNSQIVSLEALSLKSFFLVFLLLFSHWYYSLYLDQFHHILQESNSEKLKTSDVPVGRRGGVGWGWDQG